MTTVTSEISPSSTSQHRSALNSTSHQNLNNSAAGLSHESVNVSLISERDQLAEHLNETGQSQQLGNLLSSQLSGNVVGGAAAAVGGSNSMEKKNDEDDENDESK